MKNACVLSIGLIGFLISLQMNVKNITTTSMQGVLLSFVSYIMTINCLQKFLEDSWL